MISFLRLIIIVFAFFLASCHSTSTLHQASVSSDCTRASYQRVHNATYNTKIDFYKKHFSGLLLFKAINDTDTRVVFVTETGFKLFDFEFTPTNFNVQYCLPPLRKKVILNIFKSDLGQLIKSDAAAPAYVNRKDSIITFTFVRGNNSYEDYKVGPACGQLIGIERRGRFVKHVSTRISGITNGNFDEINIYHHALKLHITLKQIAR